MLYIYLIPIFIIVAIFSIFYHPKSEFARSENNTVKEYINFLTLIAGIALIPAFNIIVAFVCIDAVLVYSGVTKGFKALVEKIEEQIEDWLSKEL